MATKKKNRTKFKNAISLITESGAKIVNIDRDCIRKEKGYWVVDYYEALMWGDLDCTERIRSAKYIVCKLRRKRNKRVKNEVIIE